MYVYVYVCMDAYEYVLSCMCICICESVRLCPCVCVHMRMCVYVYVRESPTPLKGEEKSDKKRRYFYSNPNCVWRRKSTPLRARKNKKERRANVRRISRAVWIVSCSFYGKRFCSRRDVCVDILPFFHNKSMQGEKKRYFCILSLGEF